MITVLLVHHTISAIKAFSKVISDTCRTWILVWQLLSVFTWQ